MEGANQRQTSQNLDKSVTISRHWLRKKVLCLILKIRFAKAFLGTFITFAHVHFKAKLIPVAF